MDYQEALAALGRLEGRGMKLGLDRIVALLDALGKPHHGLRGVLVAGTNGKGSVCALVESMARAAGLRTVLLTKPHLLSWCERIAIDGIPITEAGFADLVARVLAASRELEGDLASPTVFEVITAAGILAAHDTAPDVLVCEVGLGGRLDSTNVLDLGVAVVTGIGLDHTAELGHDLAGIAAEKAAIIKRDNDVVTGTEGVALTVVRDAARDAGARSLVAVGADAAWQGEDRGRDGIAVTLAAPHLEVAAPLIGAFQQRNLAVAVHTALALRGRGIAIPDSAVVTGAATVRWPGRMQWIDGSPALLVDGCHNPEAVAAMAAAAAPLCRGHRTVAVFGAMADKDLGGMLEGLRALTTEVVFAAPASPRAARAADLAGLWGPQARTAGSVAAALRDAEEAAGPDGVVVVCGSLYTAGEALEARGVALSAGGRDAG